MCFRAQLGSGSNRKQHRWSFVSKPPCLSPEKRTVSMPDMSGQASDSSRRNFVNLFIWLFSWINVTREIFLHYRAKLLPFFKLLFVQEAFRAITYSSRASSLNYPLNNFPDADQRNRFTYCRDSSKLRYLRDKYLSADNKGAWERFVISTTRPESFANSP